MKKLFKLNGALQNYAWGGKEYIPDLLSQPKNGDKYAEYWMGAHDKAPSIVFDGENSHKLNEWIQRDPLSILGPKVAGQFGKLPFLFKVLDVSDMLSIQVHPSKVEAEKGYVRENNEGIPLTAKHRNYKDDNHKPEIMVALSEFWLLHGFLPVDRLKKILSDTPELLHLVKKIETGGYKSLYQFVMEEPADKTNNTLRPLIDRILPLYYEGKLDKHNPDYWAAKAFLTFCPEGDIDKGIYSIYFFNIVKANSGEVIFQDAGVPHAYMEGQNVELMANSDNVLRGGLTPKHVDVPELLKHVVFEETIPNVMSGDLQEDGLERIYKSPAPDFQLSKIDLSVIPYESTAHTIEIIIVIHGDIIVTEGSTELVLKRGETCLLTAGSNYQISATDSAILYKATTPV